MSLMKEYKENIRPKLKDDLGLSSIDAVPQIEKIVVNMGVGKMRDNKAFISECVSDLMVITGQFPSKRNAKVSISNFKLRKGQLSGIMVTLRGEKMWDFYEKFVKIVLPRVKDFRGVTKKYFDEQGNYSLGLKEHLVFPEVDANKITYTKPLQITIKVRSGSKKSSYSLLKALGMPFND